MRLILSSERVRNAVMSIESGQVLYKSAHKIKLGRTRGTTKIEKIKPSDDPMDMRDQFDVFAHIEWHFAGPSIFRIHGRDLRSDEFLRRHGVLGRKRTFTGPDGRSYRWDMFYNTVVLSRDDETKKELARYHRATLGLTAPKRYPYLDIEPEVEHMLDMIVVTFIYFEQLHIQKDRRGKIKGRGKGKEKEGKKGEEEGEEEGDGGP